MKLVTVVGARPQFIKAAVLSRLIAKSSDIEEFLVHTGQHYDANMSAVFFEELGIRKPDVSLNAGAGSHAEQTAKMLIGIERVLCQQKPDAVVVFGDTNSTLAGALAAAKLQIPVAHVEAGLRSFDRSMPEEINRCMTDQLSTWHLCPTRQAVDNLRREGITEKVYQVGDVMFDALLYYTETSGASSTLRSLGLSNRPFVLCTLHRAGNTDDPARLTRLWNALNQLSTVLPVVLPLHPRTRNALTPLQLPAAADDLHVVDPVGYREMIALEQAAALIATDSGGVQKEAYFHKVPCLTLRDNTEWTETVASGWNKLVGANGDELIDGACSFLQKGPPAEHPDFYGDGHAGHQIIELLTAEFRGARAA